jgi:hypothetical protein
MGTGLNLYTEYKIDMGNRDYFGNIISPNSSHNIGAFHTDQSSSIINPSAKRLTILEITPNPSSENFKIGFENYSNSLVRANITDISGKIVDSRTSTDDFIQYSNMRLTDGIYFITVYGLEKTYVGKLIVK